MQFIRFTKKSTNQKKSSITLPDNHVISANYSISEASAALQHNCSSLHVLNYVQLHFLIRQLLHIGQRREYGVTQWKSYDHLEAPLKRLVYKHARWMQLAQPNNGYYMLLMFPYHKEECWLVVSSFFWSHSLSSLCWIFVQISALSLTRQIV